jgi:hypothetical protein
MNLERGALVSSPRSRNAASTFRRVSSGCAIVINPSAQLASQRAVSTLTAAPIICGSASGSVHSRAYRLAQGRYG